MNVAEIEKLIADGLIIEAMEAIGEDDSADADYLRGRIAWKQGNHAAAISAYTSAADKDPSGPGAIALEQTQVIMNFYNTDLYNP